MGYIHTKIRLGNPRREGSRAMEVITLVDTASNYLCLPATIVAELGLESDTRRIVTTADGGKHECRYVGPVEVRFADRVCFVGALELGDEVLLGAIALEDMDLVINPSRQTLTVNPDYPNAAHGLAKGFASQQTTLRR
jgi:clan AA aspartic protease